MNGKVFLKNKTLLLLEAVAASAEGLSYTDMQKFIVVLNGLDWEKCGVRRRWGHNGGELAP